MPQWYTLTVNMTLQSSPTNEGVLTATGTAQFQSQPDTYFASVRSFTASFGDTDHHVKTVGAGITQLQQNGNNVDIVAELQLTDDDNDQIDPASSALAIDVTAYCE